MEDSHLLKVLLFSFFIFLSQSSFSQDDFDGFDDLDLPELDSLEDIKNDDINASLDTSLEEASLLQIADKLAFKIPDDEWEGIKNSANVTSSYTVQQGDWLFKISKNLFGTGHYYPKIWALNPYITNPHEIEPGMVLVFNSSASTGPTLTLGEPGVSAPNTAGVKVIRSTVDWEKEKANLISQGIVVDYASNDMKEIVEDSYKPDKDDYKIYSPPSYDDIKPEAEKDPESGGVFVDIKTRKKFKQGFAINTFVSNNDIESVGKITDAQNNSQMILNHDVIYVELDRGDMSEGDTFSVFETLPGLITSDASDRSGYQTIVHGHIKLLRRLEKKWEAEVFGVVNSLNRGMKLMKYTPKLKKINKRYASNQIESYVLSSYNAGQTHFTIGDIIFLDRGSSDGVKMGMVFGTFDRKDRLTNKNIQRDPTYMTGQLAIIGLSDEFATGLVTTSYRAIRADSFAITIPEDFKAGRLNFDRDESFDDEGNGLEDDEVAKALNSGDDDADLIDLEEELENGGEEEFLDDNELDLLEDDGLEDLEDVIEEESIDLDEDLEGELDALDGESEFVAEDLENLEEIEEQSGKVYLEESLNEKENPFGLSEGDLEEVDELLNMELDE